MSERGSAFYQLSLLILSLYVLAVLVVETFIITDEEVSRLLQYVDLAICAVFLSDFFVNLYRAENRWGYLRWGWIDFISSIPAIDPLRWGRITRVVRILRYLRAVRSFRVLYRGIVASRYESLSLVIALIVFFSYTICSALILEFERAVPGSNIQTAEDALWWAFLTMMNAKPSIDQTVSGGATAVTLVLNKVGLLTFAYVNSMIIAWLVTKPGREASTTS
ncbi:MAG: ion transporter [Pseudomonadales bacterium]